MNYLFGYVDSDYSLKGVAWEWSGWVCFLSFRRPVGSILSLV